MIFYTDNKVEWAVNLFGHIVENMTVYGKGDIWGTFKDGKEV